MTSNDDFPEMLGGIRVPDTIAAITERDEELLPSQSGTLQVITAAGPQAGSPYVVEVRPTDDVAIALPGEKAVAYAVAVHTAAVQAIYFAGVRAQMRDVLSGRGARPGMPDAEETTEWMVGSFIQEVLPPDHDATAPLRFEPGYRRSTGEPVVRVTCNGELVSAWSPASARHHAEAVLNTAVSANLDSAYRTFAAGNIGVEEHRARAMVHDLGKYLPVADEDPGARGTEVAPAARPRVRVPGPPPGARPAGGKRRKKR